MKALLIIAHGSRRAESNTEIRHLAATIAQQAHDTYAFVGSAFLELAEPSIPDGIEYCMQLGATDITIMPFFLSAGRHVVTDVPALVKAKQQAYPHLRIHMAPYLGVSSLMPQLILQAAHNACECQPNGCRYPECLNLEKQSTSHSVAT